MTTNQVLQTIGTVLLFANSTYNPADTNFDLHSSITDDIDMASLAADGARQSVKADLGMPHAAAYSVDMAVNFATDAQNGTVNLYWSESNSATAAAGNMGACTGADGAYTGYSTLTLAESLRHLLIIGAFQPGVNNQADGPQVGHVGIFRPVQQWGCLVVHNTTDDAFDTDSVEIAVRFTPIIPDIQAAA